MSAILAEKRGQQDAMIEHLKNAVKLEDKEPLAWYFPIHEALGNALLKTDNTVEAENIFR